MDVIETAAGCRALLDAARATGRTVGLVPTMGALHPGHISLITRAAKECDVVAVSIFVNPLQFGDPEDIARYPRTLERDLAACAEAGAHVVFSPAIPEMYPSWPEPPATTVTVHGVSDKWEGASRPGHFDGVATVVAKLFAAAGPCRAYFGLKDFQQLAVVRTMASDLCIPVDIVGCPTVREHDGLALSSRNVRLSDPERVAARALSQALAAGRATIAAGERDGAAVHAAMRAVTDDQPLVDLDYAVAVDAATLDEVATIADPATVRLLIAATVGPVRLIDNSAALDDADHAPHAPVPAHVHDHVPSLERIG
ncbi:MAG TPA: pantoate--beta-alanine ligase [Acidimicrobiales bacterium]|jgi:pantoate--beta-alanine ligase|nr:pantoate--beta-alanine ligase [Acidimicrobiales bacterium]